MYHALTHLWGRIPGQTRLLGGGLLIYLVAFYVVSFLGIAYALPLLWILPVIVFYLFQSILYPILLLIPMIGGTYLGNIVKVIPDGVVPLTLFQIFLLLGLVAFFFHYLIYNREKIRTLGVEMELLLMLTFISFTIIYSPNRESALIHLSRITFLIITAYLIVNILKEKVHFYWILGLVIILAVILGMFSIRNTILDPETAILNIRAGGTRIFGRGAITIDDPNVFATLFFLPLACTTSVFLSRLRYHWRLPALFLTLVLLAGLASTYSRSAWIAAAILLLALVIHYRQYKMMAITFAAVIVTILIVPELRTMSIGFFNRILDIFAGITDDSSRVRVLLGLGAVQMFFDSWMLGVGFRGFPELFTNYYSLKETIGVVEPHNVIYELLAELGVIGFGLVLVFITIIFRKAFHNIKQSVTESDKVIATSLFSTLIAFIIFYQFYGGAMVSTNLWALIGMIIAQGYYLKNTKEIS